MNHENEIIGEAFSRFAGKHEEISENNPHQARLRKKVYDHLIHFLPAQSRILELNSGTGVDAIALALRGYRIHATDIATGMLDLLDKKVTRLNLQDSISHQLCSFEELEKVTDAPYDAVFSNMGGLNCIADLTPVIRSLPKVLKPGGFVTCVLMPPVCLWEIAEVFRGKPRNAFRRFNRHGTVAQLEGLMFKVHYFTPRRVIRWFGVDFRLLRLEGLSVLTPTMDSKNFAARYPKFYSALAKLDDLVSAHAPWSGMGDFFICTFQYSPQ